MNQQKLCLECSAPINGRADKKFCDDLCRSSFNNRRNRDTIVVMRATNSILRRNRKILFDLKDQKSNKVSKMSLIKKGFQFDYHTSIGLTKSGKELRYSYDLGCLIIDADYCRIVKKEIELN